MCNCIDVGENLCRPKEEQCFEFGEFICCPKEKEASANLKSCNSSWDCGQAGSDIRDSNFTEEKFSQRVVPSFLCKYPDPPKKKRRSKPKKSKCQKAECVCRNGLVIGDCQMIKLAVGGPTGGDINEANQRLHQGLPRNNPLGAMPIYSPEYVGSGPGPEPILNGYDAFGAAGPVYPQVEQEGANITAGFTPTGPGEATGRPFSSWFPQEGTIMPGYVPGNAVPATINTENTVGPGYGTGIGPGFNTGSNPGSNTNSAGTAPNGLNPGSGVRQMMPPTISGYMPGYVPTGPVPGVINPETGLGQQMPSILPEYGPGSTTNQRNGLGPYTYPAFAAIPKPGYASEGPVPTTTQPGYNTYGAFVPPTQRTISCPPCCREEPLSAAGKPTKRCVQFDPCTGEVCESNRQLVPRNGLDIDTTCPFRCRPQQAQPPRQPHQQVTVNPPQSTRRSPTSKAPLNLVDCCSDPAKPINCCCCRLNSELIQRICNSLQISCPPGGFENCACLLLPLNMSKKEAISNTPSGASTKSRRRSNTTAPATRSNKVDVQLEEESAQNIPGAASETSNGVACACTQCCSIEMPQTRSCSCYANFMIADDSTQTPPPESEPQTKPKRVNNPDPSQQPSGGGCCEPNAGCCGGACSGACGSCCNSCCGPYCCYPYSYFYDPCTGRYYYYRNCNYGCSSCCTPCCSSSCCKRPASPSKTQKKSEKDGKSAARNDNTKDRKQGGNVMVPFQPEMKDTYDQWMQFQQYFNENKPPTPSTRAFTPCPNVHGFYPAQQNSFYHRQTHHGRMNGPGAQREMDIDWTPQ